MPAKKLKTKDRIDCLWGLICSLSSIDSQRNNISLFNVIDQLNIPKDKIPPRNEEGTFQISLQHEIVFVWRRLLHQDLCTEAVSTDLKILSVDPNGKILGETISQLKFNPGQRVMRYRVQNNGFNISFEGDYVYKISIVQPGTDKPVQALEIPYNVRFI